MSSATLSTIHIVFADNGNIRKWSREPFEGAAEYCPAEQGDVARAEAVTKAIMTDLARQDRQDLSKIEQWMKEPEANALRKAVRAALSTPADEWQPIADAPRDGAWVDLWWPGVSPYRPGHAMYGRWNDDRYATKPRPYWTRADERILGTTECRRNQPTRFRPLPSPPKESRDGE